MRSWFVHVLNPVTLDSLLRFRVHDVPIRLHRRLFQAGVRLDLSYVIVDPVRC